MKKTTLLIALFSVTLTSFGQHNPFAEFGYTPKIATLSQGKFNEFHDQDSIVQIGSVLFNTRTQQIVAFVEKDTLYSEATLEPDIVSRWLSPDPLAHKFPELNPYNFVSNTPIQAIDPDGREIRLVHRQEKSQFKQAIYNTLGANDVARNVSQQLMVLMDYQGSMKDFEKTVNRYLKKNINNEQERGRVSDITMGLATAIKSENILNVDFVGPTQNPGNPPAAITGVDPTTPYTIPNGDGKLERIQIDDYDRSQSTNIWADTDKSRALIINTNQSQNPSQSESNSLINGIIQTDQTLTNAKSEKKNE